MTRGLPNNCIVLRSSEVTDPSCMFLELFLLLPSMSFQPTPSPPVQIILFYNRAKGFLFYVFSFSYPLNFYCCRDKWCLLYGAFIETVMIFINLILVKILNFHIFIFFIFVSTIIVSGQS